MSKTSKKAASAANRREEERRAREAAAARTARRRMWLIGGIAAVVAIGIIIAVVLVATTKREVTPGTDPWGARKPEDGKGLVWGQPGNKVTVKLYEDALCSHCLDLEKKIGPSLEKLAHEGKMTLEVHPLQYQGPSSAMASGGLACAAEGGFVGRMHSAVMDQAQEWNIDKLTTLATQIAPDKADDFKRCISTKRYDGWVKATTKKAEADGVTSTPQLFINGQKVNHSAINGEADFVKLLDEAAAK